MAKKTAPETITNKKTRQKHKEMFSELATHQEEIVQRRTENNEQHARRVIAQDSEEQVELQILENQNHNLDAICQTVHKLLSKNKVSAKNAFDVPMIDLQRLPDFSDSLENEYAWKKLSSTLQNDYKIYGYRVDAIHSITFNMLHTMSRRQQDIDSLQSLPQSQAALPDTQAIKINDNVLENQHLQRKIQNLNLQEVDLAMGVDPILQRTKRQLDCLGNRMMMLNTLQIDTCLGLQLVNNNLQKIKYPPYGEYNDIWNVDDPLMTFVSLSNFRNTFEQGMEGKMKEEDLNQLFNNQKENYFTGNSRMVDEEYRNYKKAITQEIHFNHKVFKTEQDFKQDAQKWMNQIDRKFLGVKSKHITVKSQNVFKEDLKLQDSGQVIDFTEPNVLQYTKDFIFKPDTDKIEMNQQLQDKFLLMTRMNHHFSLTHNSLFLKETEQEQEIEHKQNMEQEIDVRRQLISIMQAKKKIKQHLHARSTFKDIYYNYWSSEDVSPALCFLTVLHLANQNNLNLESVDETNFYVH